MASDRILQNVANYASVLTFLITSVGTLVGVYGYFRYRIELKRKSDRLEEYLSKEKDQDKENNSGAGQRSLLNIIRHVGLTEDEIIKISFVNQKIMRKIKADEKGLADCLLFEYEQISSSEGKT